MQLQPHASLERIVPPSALPLTLPWVKAHCRVEHAEDDTYLARLIEVAVEAVDGKGALGRAVMTQTWRQWAGPASGEVRLLMTPVQALTEVQYRDAEGVLQPAALADFEIVGTADDMTVRPRAGASWPPAADRPDAIALTYRAGYGDTSAAVPQSVRHAILMMVAHWYDNRESASGQGMVEVPYAARHLLSLERAAWYG